MSNDSQRVQDMQQHLEAQPVGKARGRNADGNEVQFNKTRVITLVFPAIANVRDSDASHSGTSNGRANEFKMFVVNQIAKQTCGHDQANEGTKICNLKIPVSKNPISHNKYTIGRSTSRERSRGEQPSRHRFFIRSGKTTLTRELDHGAGVLFESAKRWIGLVQPVLPISSQNSTLGLQA
ncbi:hypothetical protein C8R42DRAFT_707931 [Lentinula raphanica]|nr:hypothetical protein C8R42DRAFT_707931 [Lentinula raphanica]